TNRTLGNELPRRQEDLVTAAEVGGIDHAHALANSLLSLAKKRLDHEKAVQGRQKAVEQLAKLKKDRQLAILKAPMDGTIYYGAVARGKWSDKTKIDPQLRPGGTVAAKQVFMTIVSPQPLLVRVDLEEKNLHLVRAGTLGIAAPVGFPDVGLQVKVIRVSRVPLAAGVFDCLMRVEAKADASLIQPGMTCAITLQDAGKKAPKKGTK
ncbi:MAG: efflux RND transporter periplasmic adaptor subunit, partial [Planctomycetales bacterium]